MKAILQRLSGAPRATLRFELNGQACTAQQGDTVLTAVLTQDAMLRETEFSAQPRAGFCMMGACQDCWVQTVDGRRLRACSSFIGDGMRLMTRLAP